MELKKNQIFESEITSWSSDGAGVCRIGGRAVFVPGAIPGERWEIRIVKVTKTAVFGKGETLLSPSPYRIEPDCPHYKKCGGCSLRHASYEGELEFKLERVNEAYKRIGGIDLRAGEIIGADDTLHYRNKAIYAIGQGPVKGFFRPRSHDVVAIDSCLIQDEASDPAAKAVCDFMAENGIAAYDELSGKGLVRHVFTRYGRTSGELQVTVVAAGGFGAKTQALAEAIRKACPQCVSIVLNVNRSKGNTVLAGDFYTLWGKDTITDTLCGLDFELSARSFYQINPVQAEKLYYKALEYASPDGKGLILDLYCGAGTISLCLARGCEKVIGAEIVPEAVENARENAKRNGIENAEFICADAADAAAELLRRGTRPDAVVVDPPRKGLAPDVIDSICGMNPQRVVYVSCDVSTQARDLKLFEEKGYVATKATAVDMFPRTSHVETVVCLSREKTDDCAEKPKMISEERSKYKSWSNLKKQMNDLLCDALKGKISYFYTSYHEVHNAYGRATINYEKKELVAFSWVEMYKQEQEVSQLYSEGKKVSYGEMEMKKWMPECKLCDADFINSLTIYLKTDIATALHSENYLLRVFAYMDRRAGKRTLVKIKDEVEKLPEWVKQFYRLRCEADGIVFHINE